MKAFNSDSLFPLPLTPFEHYMWADDRPSYPMTGVLEYHFRGLIQREPWDAALAESLERHPLLTAHIAANRLGTPRWIAPSKPPTPVDWGAATEPILAPMERIDLTRENGLRVIVRQGDGCGRVLTQVHHASTDALGVMRFFGDVLAAYARRVNPDQPCPEVAPLDAKCLLNRGAPRWGEAAEPVSFWESCRGRLRDVGHWFTRRPTPIALPRRDSRSEKVEPPDYPSIQYHTFSADATATLREAAHEVGGSLNDLLLRDLFVTLAQWNRAHCRRAPGKWLSVNMPTSLRKSDDAAMPAANVVSYAFLTRRHTACQDPASLLEGIQHDTRAIKRWNLGMIFLEGLSTAQRVPGLLPLTVLGSRCFATAVLTNLGDPGRSFGAEFPAQDGAVSVAGLQLERLIAAPPLRPKTHAVFCITRHANRLTLSVRGAPRCLTPPDTKQLLQAYVETICSQSRL